MIIISYKVKHLFVDTFYVFMSVFWFPMVLYLVFETIIFEKVYPLIKDN